VLPDVTGLGWAQVRGAAQVVVAAHSPNDVVLVAATLLDSESVAQRQLAVYLLGFTSGERDGNLELLRTRVVGDPSWQVQEALAQAFDAYCAAVGYTAALPAIDAWLADEHPNARRAVSEGLRPWTAKQRTPFARDPAQAIRRLAALRADASEYVRHSAGNALRDIRRRHATLVDAEVATWNLDDSRVAFTHQRVLAPR
jgi:hypothetical protein